ncbi:MAG TPA: uroporphyrinogen decarboxylase family protein [Ktedonobacterales bacterium]
MAELIPTTVVGSYPQPEWLVDRENLRSRLPPRIRAREIWRIPEPFLEQAQDDATLLAIRDMERAGVDIISDGEIRRESYSNRFATALEGLDLDHPGTAIDRTGHPNPVPRVVGPIRRTRPVEVRDLEFLRLNTDHRVKITVPGPFTVAQQAQNDYYPDDRALALDLAAAINEEIKDLFAAGADVVQIDEPYLQARPEKARAYGVEVINRALDGVEGVTALHMCFGYAAVVHDRPGQYAFLPELNECVVQQISIEAAQPKLDLSALEALPSKTIMLGVLNLGDLRVETAEEVAGRIRAALRHIAPERLIVAPDCGMKYLPRDVAFGKLQAMTQGAALVREELR